MGHTNAQRAPDILNRMIREKDISAAFFGRIADSLEDVDQRRWFRRMGQDEKDQRKILLKHRRSICSSDLTPDVAVSVVHGVIDNSCMGPDSDFLEALRLAVRSADYSRDDYDKNSDLMSDRSCRIFLKILAGESEGHRRALLKELRRVERELVVSVEELAA